VSSRVLRKTWLVTRRVGIVLAVILVVVSIPLRCASDFTAMQVVREFPHEAANLWWNLFHGSAKLHGYPLEQKKWKGTLLEEAVYYRPILLFDTSEPWRPLRIDDWFKREHGLRVCYAGECDSLVSPSA